MNASVNKLCLEFLVCDYPLQRGGFGTPVGPTKSWYIGMATVYLLNCPIFSPGYLVLIFFSHRNRKSVTQSKGWKKMKMSEGARFGEILFDVLEAC